MPERHWWTCHHEDCLDRMAQSEWAETVIRDRDAHIAEHQPRLATDHGRTPHLVMAARLTWNVAHNFQP